MKKFNKAFARALTYITEADAPPPPPPPPPGGDAGAEGVDEGMPPAPPADAPPAEKPQPEVLSSQGEVMLAKLASKCFGIKPSDDDQMALARIGEINEKNARKVIDTLRNIVKKYSTDDDI